MGRYPNLLLFVCARSREFSQFTLNTREFSQFLKWDSDLFFGSTGLFLDVSLSGEVFPP